MSKPTLVGKVDGWMLTRWDYDGASLQAERGDIDCVDIESDGELSISVRTSGYGGCSHALGVPAAVLVALVEDALARGVLTLPAIVQLETEKAALAAALASIRAVTLSSNGHGRSGAVDALIAIRETCRIALAKL